MVTEPILDDERREIEIVLARKELSLTYARYSADERIAGAHVHYRHTDAFYVLEGDVAFELGRERETMTLSRGAFVAVPPGVAHALRAGGHGARLLAVHAADGGFGAFLRGLRDGVSVEWDIGAVPADGRRTGTAVIVHPESGRVDQ